MPAIPLHPPSLTAAASASPNPLPQLLQTPSGLAIVEIQGTINLPGNAASLDEEETDGADAQGQGTAVGRLAFPLFDSAADPADTKWMKRIYLYIGKHQRLTGEVKKLPKPLAVIRRRDESQQGEELELAEIVKYKILFAHRPEPVGVEEGQ